MKKRRASEREMDRERKIEKGWKWKMEIWCVDRWYGNGDGNEGLGIGNWEKGEAICIAIVIDVR